MAQSSAVPATPETIKKLIGQGHKVTVQSGAGINAGIVDSAYEAVGATIGSANDAFGAELILKVVAPSDSELTLIKNGTVVVGMLNPFSNEITAKLAECGITAFALEAASRTSRAQSLDVMSSQANIHCHHHRTDAGLGFRLGRADHHPDRRRGHASGSVDAQQLFGLGGGRYRFLAEQLDADHRRLVGGFVRCNPLVHHVQGDEPFLL